MAVTTEKYIFSEMLRAAERNKIVPNKTRAARDWFRVRAQDMGNINRNNFFRDKEHQVNVPRTGNMYMFVYDAKHKDTLPFWDAFPLIFMVGPAENGFYGINLHYLQPLLRARLMDALYNIANNKRYDENTRLKINYQTLKAAGNISYFKPCFKHYLFSQVGTRFQYVEPKEWDIAAFLPTANFKKATQQQVWRETRNAI
jgi:hypothetical protein